MNDTDAIVRGLLEQQTPLRTDRRPDWADVLARSSGAGIQPAAKRKRGNRRRLVVALALLATLVIVTAGLAASGLYPFADDPAPSSGQLPLGGEQEPGGAPGSVTVPTVGLFETLPTDFLAEHLGWVFTHARSAVPPTAEVATSQAANAIASKETDSTVRETKFVHFEKVRSKDPRFSKDCWVVSVDPASQRAPGGGPGIEPDSVPLPTYAFVVIDPATGDVLLNMSGSFR